MVATIVLMQDTGYANFLKMYDISWTLGANLGGLFTLYATLLALNLGLLYLLRYKHSARC